MIGIVFSIMVEISILVHPDKKRFVSHKTKKELIGMSVFVYATILISLSMYIFKPEIVSALGDLKYFENSKSATSGLILFLIIGFYNLVRMKPWKQLYLFYC